MPKSQRDTSLAQLGAAAEAFALEPTGGAGAVETARRAGVRLLSGRDEAVQGPPDSHGNEHDIWFREMAGEARVIKITRGKYALYGISDELHQSFVPGRFLVVLLRVGGFGLRWVDFVGGLGGSMGGCGREG